ncbi:unnamed protein product [Phyllotreta striolata]|uniref:C2H2-type domain-containing protein n=1 Tax=Phyllotreta striolata TaxID=444603 RepID=A0A9N9TY79_PHYSR|nr:unnamed protein product [Phyllotreta striolata]
MNILPRTETSSIIVNQPVSGASCSTCGKSFKNVNSLRAHMSLDCMKTSFFKCKACPFISKRRFNMKMHYATKHKIEVHSGNLTKITRITF